MAARPIRLALLLLLVLAAALGCRRRHVAVRHETPAAQRGHALYLKYCALCHGKRAEGYAADHANAIGNRDFLALTSDEQLRMAIVDGRPGTPMSAWGAIHGGPLGAEQVNDIVAFLRSKGRRSKVKVDDVKVIGDASRGSRAYAAQCATCHGSRGEGTTKATSLSHPNFLHSVSDGYLAYTILHGRRGTPMPPFATLGPQTVDDLVVYLRTLEVIPNPPPPDYEPPPGLDQLVLNPTGAPPKFALRDGRYVSAADVAKALEEKRKMVLLDARATSDFHRSHIVGALPFPFYDAAAMAKALPRDGTFIVAYCACPHAASGHVVDELRKKGFKNTAVLDEGISFWIGKGYPTAQSKVIPKAPKAP